MVRYREAMERAQPEGLRQCLRNGTTTVCDNHHGGQLLDHGMFRGLVDAACTSELLRVRLTLPSSPTKTM
jgi:hypothetical protein